MLETFVVVVFFATSGPVPVQYSYEAVSCSDAQLSLNKTLADSEPIAMYCTVKIGELSPVNELRFFRSIGMMNQPVTPKTMTDVSEAHLSGKMADAGR